MVFTLSNLFRKPVSAVWKRERAHCLDRDPSQSMHAQREGEFTSMMKIVLNEMPDNPLACIGLIFSILIGIVNNFCQIGNGPVVQGILNDLPGGFQSLDQFGSGTGRLTRQRDQMFIALFQGIIKPASTHPDDMGCEIADRTELRCGTQGELLECQRLNSLDKQFLIGIPAFIKGEKRNLLFSHKVSSFFLLFSQLSTKIGGFF